MACYVYILGSEANGAWRSYVGWTTDLDQRLARHNAGSGAKSTRGRVWFLLYAERFKTRSEAMSREWHLKRDRSFRKSLGAAHSSPNRHGRARPGHPVPKSGVTIP